MLDLKYIKENAEAVKANIAARFMTADVDEVISLYDRRNALITETDDLRRRRNENAKSMKGKLDPEERQKLHRVSACVVPNRLLDHPTVIGHARLVILGTDNVRLHDHVRAREHPAAGKRIDLRT